MTESSMPYEVRKEKDVLEKVVKMKERREELKQLIIETAGKVYDISGDLRAVRAKLREVVKQYDQQGQDVLAKSIADLSVTIKRYRSELRTAGRELKQYVADLRSLEGKGGTINE